MKRILTFWLPIGVLFSFFSFVAYTGIDNFLGITKFITVLSDEDIYRELQEPLIGTISNNGTTLHPNHDKGQLFVYSFDDYATKIPYRITLSKNVDFEDCAGCIGDWNIGMFSYPEYNGNHISLKEFILQMVRAKNENISRTNNMVWNTSGFIWKITPTAEKGTYIVEVSSSHDKKWKIIM